MRIDREKLEDQLREADERTSTNEAQIVKLMEIQIRLLADIHDLLHEVSEATRETAEKTRSSY